MSLMIESATITDSLFFELFLLLLILFFVFELVTIFLLLCKFKVVISCFGMLSMLCLMSDLIVQNIFCICRNNIIQLIFRIHNFWINNLTDNKHRFEIPNGSKNEHKELTTPLLVSGKFSSTIFTFIHVP